MKIEDMTEQENIDYHRIEAAIAYITEHFKQQPSLEEIAQQAHLSPFHFQRLFTRWAGVSPKKFMEFVSIGYAKRLLHKEQATLFDTAYQTGLSGTGRLHDLFVKLEGMTPGEFKNGGENLSICYSMAETPFGNMLVASTTKGVCHMAFFEEQAEALQALKTRFPNAVYQQAMDGLQQQALSFFRADWQGSDKIRLHVKGTPFQLKVWEALLQIPLGDVTTYGKIAKAIGKPKASRAVGTSIGSNPIAFLIPCHRVIQASGKVGGYMWGSTRKTAIIGWEAGRIHA